MTAPVAGEAVSSALPDISVQIHSFSYTAFGEQMGTVKVSGFTYNAEAYDATTGMLNLRARQYEPALNRFSQKDIYPANLLITISFNAYLFTCNSPVSFVDIDGANLSSITKTLSSIGNQVKKVATSIGTAVKTVATAVVGQKVVNSVVSKVNSVTKTVAAVAKNVGTAVANQLKLSDKVQQIIKDTQAEIAALDKSDPDYNNKVSSILKSACTKVSDPLYYSNGIVYYGDYKYPIPSSSIIIKQPQFEAADRETTIILSESSKLSQSLNFNLLNALGYGEMQGSDDLALNNFKKDGKQAMGYYGAAALLASLGDYLAAGVSRSDINIVLSKKGNTRYANILVGSFAYQQLVYNMADGKQRYGNGIEITLSPERRENFYYGQLVTDQNGQVAIEQFIFNGDRIIIDGVDRTNTLRYPIEVDDGIWEVLEKMIDEVNFKENNHVN